MHRIVKLFRDGKNSWDAEELQSDPSILRAINEAYALGLILRPRIDGPSKSPDTYGTPRVAVVVGLTPAGRAQV